MPIPTPFHERTRQLCHSLLYKDWGGYYTVRSYDTTHEGEYFAIRHSAALIDVSPLFKYEVYGPEAGAFLSHLMVRDPRKLKIGRVAYLCWCDDAGKVVDDGTVMRLEKDRYRVTAAEPAYSWLAFRAQGFDVTLEDASLRLGALAVQGPNSREVLKQVSDADLDNLPYFGLTQCKLEDADVWITRTGYTGDLGYEVWVEREDAIKVYDSILENGRPYRAMPCGLDAMDVARIEAGYIMNGVDYYSAHHCLIEARKSTPFELGLDWTVKMKKHTDFIGYEALEAERKRGPALKLMGLVYDWDEFEALHEEVGLPPQVSSMVWRDPVPIYDDAGEQIGRATSGAWSPTLKQNLALASLDAAYAEPGTQVRVEVTVEWVRKVVTATVTPTPFFDPERKRA